MNCTHIDRFIHDPYILIPVFGRKKMPCFVYELRSDSTNGGRYIDYIHEAINLHEYMVKNYNKQLENEFQKKFNKTLNEKI
jgi:hypothetical protein